MGAGVGQRDAAHYDVTGLGGAVEAQAVGVGVGAYRAVVDRCRYATRQRLEHHRRLQVRAVLVGKQHAIGLSRCAIRAERQRRYEEIIATAHGCCRVQQVESRGLQRTGVEVLLGEDAHQFGTLLGVDADITGGGAHAVAEGILDRQSVATCPRLQILGQLSHHVATLDVGSQRCDSVRNSRVHAAGVGVRCQGTGNGCTDLCGGLLGCQQVVGLGLGIIRYQSVLDGRLHLCSGLLRSEQIVHLGLGVVRGNQRVDSRLGVVTGQGRGDSLRDGGVHLRGGRVVSQCGGDELLHLALVQECRNRLLKSRDGIGVVGNLVQSCLNLFGSEGKISKSHNLIF